MKIPKNYNARLSIRETNEAIKYIKDLFEATLSRSLNLTRVSAPMFVFPESGLNDNLSGTERAVCFEVPDVGRDVEVVHSLAKWKRLALRQYGFSAGEGLYTDMNAIRRDEVLDNLHSIYVDQWDWEKVIDRDSRSEKTLRETVTAIVNAICDTADKIRERFPVLSASFSRDVSFITTQQLEDMYPNLTPKEREDAYVKEHKTAFIMQIGCVLKSGSKHDGRAPDYDDWSLNGDIFLWSDVLDCAVEISSMGIRVDEKALDEQLTKADCNQRRSLPFHKMLLAGELPLTMGGGIGQSRVCMLLLQKAHVGEVQVSVWDDATIAGCKAAGIVLL